jgi:hypothetical protein
MVCLPNRHCFYHPGPDTLVPTWGAEQARQNFRFTSPVAAFPGKEDDTENAEHPLIETQNRRVRLSPPLFG